MFDFLKNVFKEKPPKEETLFLGGLEKKLNRLLGQEKKELLQQLSTRFSEIKFLLKELKEAALALQRKSLEKEGGHGKLRKIVKSCKDSFVSHLIGLTERFQPPAGQELEEIRKYCLESSALLEKDIAALWKSIAIASTLLKPEMKRIGQKLNETNQIFKELNKALEARKNLQLIPEALEAINALQDKQASLKETEGKIAVLEKELKELTAEESETKNKVTELEESPAYKEIVSLQEGLKELEEKKIELKNSLLMLLAPASKPIAKFLKLSEAKKFPLEKSEEKALRAYLENPLEAIKADPKNKMLKKMLDAIIQAIKDSTLSLKEKEKEKKIKALEELKEQDFFEKGFWKYNEILAQENKIKEKLKASAIEQKIKKLTEKLRELEGLIQEKGSDLEESKALKEKTGDEIALLKQGLEGKAGELLQKEVLLKTKQ